MRQDKSKTRLSDLNLIICSCALLCSLLVQLKVYYFNPTPLPAYCASSDFQSKDGLIQIMDCISCLSFASDTANTIQGDIYLSLPPLISLDHFTSSFYRQRQCYFYQCPNIRFGDDFYYTTNHTVLEQLSFFKDPSHEFILKVSILSRLSYMFKDLSKIEQSNNYDSNKWYTTGVSNTDASIFIRFRYSSMTRDVLPVLNYYHTSTDVEYRMVLCVLLMMSLPYLLKVLQSRSQIIVMLVVVLLGMSFVSEVVLAIASMISLYILLVLCGQVYVWFGVGISVLYACIIVLGWMGYDYFILGGLNLAVASYFITIQIERFMEKNVGFIGALSVLFFVCPMAWIYGLRYMNQFGIYYILALKCNTNEEGVVRSEESLPEIQMQ